MRWLWGAFCIMVALLSGPCYVWAGKVLVIESYSQKFQWDAGYIRGIREALGEGHEVRTFEMDTKRIPEKMFPQRAAEAMAVFRQFRPDVVILGDDNANRLMAPELLPTGVPMVFLGLNCNPREYDLYGHAHVAGIMERPLLFRAANVARTVCDFPLRKVLYLFDSSETSSIILNDVFLEGAVRDLSGIVAEMRQVSSVAEWKEVIAGADEAGYDLIFVGLMQRLKIGEEYCGSCESLLYWTAKNSPVPCMGLWDFSIGKGKLPAGLVHVSEYQGRAAGELAKRLLAGERNISIPMTVENGVFMYSRHEAAQSGLVLPPYLQKEAVAVE